MNKVGAKRLLKLADFLRSKVPRKAFDFGAIMSLGSKKPLDALRAGGGCGTVGCALGWAPACFPRDLTWGAVGGDDGEPGDRMLITLKNDQCVLEGEWHGWYQTKATARKFFDLCGEEVNTLFVPSYGKGSLSHTATPKQVAKRIERFVYEQYPDLRGA